MDDRFEETNAFLEGMILEEGRNIDGIRRLVHRLFT